MLRPLRLGKSVDADDLPSTEQLKDVTEKERPAAERRACLDDQRRADVVENLLVQPKIH